MATVKTSLARAAIAIAGALMLVAVGSTTATAAARDGHCDSGEVCFYFLSGEQGSVSDFTASVANYGTTQPTCFEFRGSGDGQFQCIKNNAESARNLSSHTVRVYFNSNFGGSFDTLPPGFVGNLHVTFNNNASHQFL